MLYFRVRARRQVNVGTIGNVDYEKAILSAAIEGTVRKRNKSDRKRNRADRWR